MNYIELINQFWQLRRSVRITSLQADIYFGLLHECNVRGWQNPFEMSNKLLCLTIGIAEPSLVHARKRLQQLGLINFVGGKRNIKAPVYRINMTFKSNTTDFGCQEPNTIDDTELSLSHEEQPLNIKLNKTRRKSAGEASLASTPCMKHFIPPTVEEVEAYCSERCNGIDARHFTDFYTSKGWLVGRAAMKDWRAAVRTWERTRTSHPAGGAQNSASPLPSAMPQGETSKKYKQL